MWKVALFFFLIFGFRIPLVQNSTILAGLIGSVIMLLDNKKIEIFTSLVKSRYFLKIALIQILLIYFSFTFITLHGTSEQFLFPKIFIAQFLYIGSAVFVLPVILKLDGNDEKRILKLFLYTFATQTLIQLLGFISPSFYQFISNFQVKEAQDAVEASVLVGLFRGFSLASDLFFGMGALYGIGFLIWVYYYSQIEKEFNNLSLLLLFALILGTIFSARTGFVGILFALFFFILQKKAPYLKLKWTLKIVFQTLFALLIVWFIIPSNYKVLLEEKIIPFAFEFLYSFADKGKFETNSTNHLLKMLDIPLNMKTLLIGDGKYVNSDGSYYMHTDSGYYRNILFWGLPGLIMIIYYQSLFINFNKRRESSLLFSILLLIFILILEIKGEAISKIHMLNIFLFCLYTAVKKDINYSTREIENIYA